MTDSISNEAQWIANEVVRRESRRVRTLAQLTVLLWVAALALVTAVELPAMAKAKLASQELSQPGPDGQPVTAPQLAARIGTFVREIVVVASIAMTMALVAGILASVCTVMLALTIRRVTLRQVNEGLAQISSQLRELKGRP